MTTKLYPEGIYKHGNLTNFYDSLVITGKLTFSAFPEVNFVHLYFKKSILSIFQIHNFEIYVRFITVIEFKFPTRNEYLIF